VLLPPPAEKLQNFFGVFLQFQIGIDRRGRMELFTEGGIQKRQAVLDLIQSKAREKNATPAQISLAWLMGKKPWIVPIPGTRKMERMIENGGAAEVHLTEGEIAEIDRALDDFGCTGMA
ncbi:aldo/keto reductase, partial [Oscillospiraceae bacterium 44-34]